MFKYLSFTESAVDKNVCILYKISAGKEGNVRSFCTDISKTSYQLRYWPFSYGIYHHLYL